MLVCCCVGEVVEKMGSTKENSNALIPINVDLHRT